MIPRLTGMPDPAPLYAAFLAELRARGFEGELSPCTPTAPCSRPTTRSTSSCRRRRLPARHATTSCASRACSPIRASPTLKLAPRGGGTGTNGQSLTDGLVVDLSRHMNRILESMSGSAAFASRPASSRTSSTRRSPHGLFFAPELSTSNRATIGGMINTDACGQGSCLYGKTRDHVLALTTVLLDGTVWTSRPLDDAELAAVKARTDRVGAIHRLVDAHPARERGADRRALPQAQPLPHRLRPRPHPRRAGPLRPQRRSSAGRRARSASSPRPSSTCCRSRSTRRSSTSATTASMRRCAMRAPWCAVQAASIETVDSRVLGARPPGHRLARGQRVLPRRPRGAGRGRQPGRGARRRPRRASKPSSGA